MTDQENTEKLVDEPGVQPEPAEEQVGEGAEQSETVEEGAEQASTQDSTPESQDTAPKSEKPPHKVLDLGERVEAKMNRMTELLTVQEKLKMEFIGKKIHKSYYRMWCLEANGSFYLLVKLKKRLRKFRELA